MGGQNTKNKLLTILILTGNSIGKRPVGSLRSSRGEEILIWS